MNFMFIDGYIPIGTTTQRR